MWNSETYCQSVILTSKQKKQFSTAFFELLFVTGLRYNDVGLIKPEDIKGEQLIMQPSKFNNKRTFSIHELPKDFLYHLTYQPLALYSIPYSTILRDFQRSRPCIAKLSDGKDILLHIFRHNYMKRLFREGKTNQEIATITGEKHISSANCYIYSSIFYE
jgi:integrase